MVEVSTQSGTPAPATRREGFVREAQMLAPLAAAASTLCLGLPGRPEVFFEVPLAAGVPDLVVVAFDATAVQERLAAGLAPVVEVSAVRTLTALEAGMTDLGDVAAAAGLSAAHLRRRVLPGLLHAGWVTPLQNSRVQLLHPFAPVASWAVAVEAKRSAWAQAASQARRMLPAADRVFVALDAARARPAMSNAAHLASVGVGLVTVAADPPTDSAPVSVISAPRRARPGLPPGHRGTTPAAKALLAERVWDLHLAGRRHGPVHPVFGRDLSVHP